MVSLARAGERRDRGRSRGASAILPRFPRGAFGAGGEGTPVWCSHARNPHFPSLILELDCTEDCTLCTDAESHLRKPLSRVFPIGTFCYKWCVVPVS